MCQLSVYHCWQRQYWCRAVPCDVVEFLSTLLLPLKPQYYRIIQLLKIGSEPSNSLLIARCPAVRSKMVMTESVDASHSLNGFTVSPINENVQPQIRQLTIFFLDKWCHPVSSDIDCGYKSCKHIEQYEYNGARVAQIRCSQNCDKWNMAPLNYVLMV